MKRKRQNTRSTTLLTALLYSALSVICTVPAYGDDTKIRHVLVISIDGMHALDMALWAENNPASNLGRLYAQGMKFTNASTMKPSDSIPSTVGLFTSGSPAIGGMYYDDAFNRAWYPAGSKCIGPKGAVIDLKQGIDLAPDGSTGVDPTKVPMQLVNGVCKP